MPTIRIDDWNNAYSNADHIPNSQTWPGAWVAPAADYRSSANCELDISYGEHPRNVYDLFSPEGKPKGLFIFIHGGYWLKLDKS